MKLMTCEITGKKYRNWIAMSDKCFRFEIGEGDYKKYDETIVKNAIINSLKNRG